VDRTRIALGLAATQAAGLKAMFGTMAKPLHAGRAAASGVLAARLAAAGFTAPLDGIEAGQGLAATQSATFRPEAVTEIIGDDWGITRTAIKMHACCGVTHPTLDALRDIRAGHGLDPDDVARLEIEGGPMVWRTCQVDRPGSGLAAKFSLRYVAALALCGLPTTPSSFTDEALRSEQTARMQERIYLRETDRDGFGVTLQLTLNDGTSLAVEAGSTRPASDADLPGQRQRLLRKFDDLVTPVLGQEGNARLRSALGSLPDVAPRQLARLTLPA
jgi:2-methylcitrate dehydratase PrpD